MEILFLEASRQFFQDRCHGSAGNYIQIHRLLVIPFFALVLFPVINEIASEADAVVQLRKSIVELCAGNRPTCQKVEFISQINKGTPFFLLDFTLPFLHLINNPACTLFIKLLQRIGVGAMLGNTDRHNGQRKCIRTPVSYLAYSAFQFHSVIETCAEHHLSMIFRSGFLQIIQLAGNAGCPSLILGHASTFAR